MAGNSAAEVMPCVSGNPVMRGDSEFLGRIEAIVENNYQDRRFGMHSLAEELGVSDRQLQRVLKKLTGNTPSQFLRDFRLRKSLMLLRFGCKVTDVARSVGFSSHAYFSCCFKTYFGITPSRYQEHGIK